MNEILVIVNPASSGGRTRERWQVLSGKLGLAGLKFDTAFTTRPLEATGLARQAVREGRRVVAAAGGDGTLNEVANGFFEEGEPISTETALALIPLGTGGDFRRTFDMPLEPMGIAGMLAGGATKVIDAGIARYRNHDGKEEVRAFANIADAGVGGEVVDRVNRSSKRLGGDLTFMLASITSLLAWRNKPMTVVVDGERRELKAQQVVAANCRYFGSGMKVAPMADPSDGLLDFLLIGDLSAMENVRGLSKIKAGRHLDEPNPKWEVMRGRRAEVSSPEQVRLDLDGEQPGWLPATFEVVPGALRLALPRR
ncbi:MAG TPA: diacylglycerol kinase family protein [Candidatus Dormibacteraeota bacterium]